MGISWTMPADWLIVLSNSSAGSLYMRLIDAEERGPAQAGVVAEAITTKISVYQFAIAI